ncbi:unnamed protein product [Ectocarpus sp. 8 AP-2014]
MCVRLMRVQLRCVSGLYFFQHDTTAHLVFWKRVCHSNHDAAWFLPFFACARGGIRIIAWAKGIFRVFCVVAFSAGQGEWGGSEDMWAFFLPRRGDTVVCIPLVGTKLAVDALCFAVYLPSGACSSPSTNLLCCCHLGKSSLPFLYFGGGADLLLPSEGRKDRGHGSSMVIGRQMDDPAKLGGTWGASQLS